MKLAKAALLLTLASAAVWAQVNAGERGVVRRFA